MLTLPGEVRRSLMTLADRYYNDPIDRCSGGRVTHSPAAHACNEDSCDSNLAKWRLALSRIEEALRLLDESGAPEYIGAQLDLAMHQLKETIEKSQGAD